MLLFDPARAPAATRLERLVATFDMQMLTVTRVCKVTGSRRTAI